MAKRQSLFVVFRLFRLWNFEVYRDGVFYVCEFTISPRKHPFGHRTHIELKSNSSRRQVEGKSKANRGLYGVCTGFYRGL